MKTYFLTFKVQVIKSQQKIDCGVNIKFENEDDTFHLLERKDRIRYLRVLHDETVSFKHHISYMFVCTKISRNDGILRNRRHLFHKRKTTLLKYHLLLHRIRHLSMEKCI